jgi:hypothetical protein
MEMWRGKRHILVMSKAHVSRLLALWFLVLWTAVLIRSDRFPLTWAPMYSAMTPNTSNVHKSLLQDRKRLDEQGFRVTYLNGEESWLPRRPLNLPKRSMWRYYYHASWNRNTARVSYNNLRLTDFERRIWGLGPDEDYEVIDWHRRLFHAVNRTLGRGPQDDCFIVRFEAHKVTQQFVMKTLESLEPIHDSASAEFDAEWEVDYPDAESVAAPAGGCGSLIDAP